MDQYKTVVHRSESLTTEQIVEHIKEVGQAIIDDSETVALNASNVRSILIEAEIAPLVQGTTVTYTIQRFADPRNRSSRKR